MLAVCVRVLAAIPSVIGMPVCSIRRDRVLEHVVVVVVEDPSRVCMRGVNHLCPEPQR